MEHWRGNTKMARAKPVNELSSEELFALAEARRMEEIEKAKEENKQKIEELRTQRRELVAQHKKDLKAIDKEIRELGGKAGTGRSRANGGSLTDTIIAIVSSAGEISTKELKAAIDSQGLNAKNLNQTLAYLKRNGRLKSPARSVYKVA